MYVIFFLYFFFFYIEWVSILCVVIANTQQQQFWYFLCERVDFFKSVLCVSVLLLFLLLWFCYLALFFHKNQENYLVCCVCECVQWYSATGFSGCLLFQKNYNIRFFLMLLIWCFILMMENEKFLVFHSRTLLEVNLFKEIIEYEFSETYYFFTWHDRSTFSDHFLVRLCGVLKRLTRYIIIVTC